MSSLYEIFKIGLFFIAGGFGGFIYLKILERNVLNIAKGKGVLANGILGFFFRIAMCAALFAGSALLGGASGFVALCVGFFIVHTYMLATKKGGKNVDKP